MELIADEKLLELIGTDPEYLVDADMGRVMATMSDAHMGRVMATMSDAHMGRVMATMSDADMGRVKNVYERFISDVPTVKNLYSKILESVNSNGCNLDQSTWECGSTRCIGGWTVFHAGEKGQELARKYGWLLAARLIHMRSRPTTPVPNYSPKVPDEAAMAFIRARAREEADDTM